MSNLWFRIQVFPPRARVSKIRSLCRPQHKKSNPLAPSAQKLEPCGARGPKACTLCRPRHKNLNPLPSAAKKLETFAAQGPESRTLPPSPFRPPAVGNVESFGQALSLSAGAFENGSRGYLFQCGGSFSAPMHFFSFPRLPYLAEGNSETNPWSPAPPMGPWAPKGPMGPPKRPRKGPWGPSGAPGPPGEPRAARAGDVNKDSL